jgi:hypothetical protein
MGWPAPVVDILSAACSVRKNIYVPPGKPVSLPPDVLAGLEQALRQPAGFASYEAVRQWLKQRYQLDVTYHTLYTIIRTRFNA